MSRLLSFLILLDREKRRGETYLSSGKRQRVTDCEEKESGIENTIIFKSRERERWKEIR